MFNCARICSFTVLSGEAEWTVTGTEGFVAHHFTEVLAWECVLSKSTNWVVIDLTKFTTKVNTRAVTTTILELSSRVRVSFWNSAILAWDVSQ